MNKIEMTDPQVMKVYKCHAYRILIYIKTFISVANFYELHSRDMFWNFCPAFEILGVIVTNSDTFQPHVGKFHNFWCTGCISLGAKIEFESTSGHDFRKRVMVEDGNWEEQTISQSAQYSSMPQF
jgi:hypothetical protein